MREASAATGEAVARNSPRSAVKEKRTLSSLSHLFSKKKSRDFPMQRSTPAAILSSRNTDTTLKSSSSPKRSEVAMQSPKTSTGEIEAELLPEFGQTRSRKRSFSDIPIPKLRPMIDPSAIDDASSATTHDNPSQSESSQSDLHYIPSSTSSRRNSLKTMKQLIGKGAHSKKKRESKDEKKDESRK